MLDVDWRGPKKYFEKFISTVKDDAFIIMDGETKIIEYDRDNFEKDLLEEDYPDGKIISKCFFRIEYESI